MPVEVSGTKAGYYSCSSSRKDKRYCHCVPKQDRIQVFPRLAWHGFRNSHSYNLLHLRFTLHDQGPAIASSPVTCHWSTMAQLHPENPTLILIPGTQECHLFCPESFCFRSSQINFFMAHSSYYLLKEACPLHSVIFSHPLFYFPHHSAGFVKTGTVVFLLPRHQE